MAAPHRRRSSGLRGGHAHGRRPQRLGRHHHAQQDADELVAALGHGDELVGRSHECDFPAEVRNLPVVSRPRREPVGTAGEIHRGVVELLEDVLSIYRVDAEALRAAAADLVSTQDLCGVCAVAEEEVWRPRGPTWAATCRC